MNRIPYQRFLFPLHFKFAHLMIRAASVSDLLFVSTTCVNCIWVFFFFPKDSLCDKADFSAHSGFNEPPGCRCDTKEACWSALLCQAQQNSIPSSEPLFRLLGRQYVGAFIWRTNLAHTLLCLCVCGTGYVCPSRLIPLISQCQGGALITRLNHVCRKNPERWLSVSVIVGCDIYIHKRLLPRVISLLPYLFP